jgi:hypothetical protein
MPDDPTVAERAVVVQLIGRAGPTQVAELYAAVPGGLTPTDIDAAVLGLAKAGVLWQAPDKGLCASAALQRLDMLGLIAI